METQDGLTFEQLWEASQSAVARSLRRHMFRYRVDTQDYEDLLQEVALRMLHHNVVARYDASKGPAAWATYLDRIVRSVVSKAVDSGRRSPLTRAQSLDDGKSAGNESDCFEHTVAEIEISRKQSAVAQQHQDARETYERVRASLPATGFRTPLATVMDWMRDGVSAPVAGLPKGTMHFYQSKVRAAARQFQQSVGAHAA